MDRNDRPAGPAKPLAREIKQLAATRMQARYDKVPMPRVPRRLTTDPDLVELRKTFEEQYWAALHPSVQLRDEVRKIAILRTHARIERRPLPKIPPHLTLEPLVALREKDEDEVRRTVTSARDRLNLGGSVKPPPAPQIPVLEPRTPPVTAPPAQTPMKAPPTERTGPSPMKIVLIILGIWFCIASCNGSISGGSGGDSGIECSDGWISHSGGGSGTCSHHGGIG